MKTERQRMLSGEPYDARDPELLALAHRSRALLARYTATGSTDAIARRELLTQLFGSIGEEVWIEPPFFCDYGAHVHIAARSFVNVNCVFLDSAEIHIGVNALIAPGVQLLTTTHPVRAAERIASAVERDAGRAPYRTFARPITVGDDVWV